MNIQIKQEVPGQFKERRYLYISQALKEQYGKKLEKVMLDGGFTCPNRDGRLGTEGCIFCSAGGSGDFAADRRLSITEQIESQIAKKEASKKSAEGYIAYFQAFTGTYAPLKRLKCLYMEAISHHQVEVVSIATRPDCLSKEILELLEELNRIKPIWIELGLQTIHEDTAQFIRRGYPLSVFEKAVMDLKRIGIPVIVHLIVGLPKENREMLLETVRYCNMLPIWGIKLQLLHILKETGLEELYKAGELRELSLSEYADLITDCIGELRPDIVIHRLTGDGAREDLLSPLWSVHKRAVLNKIHHCLKEKKIWQGKNWKHE